MAALVFEGCAGSTDPTPGIPQGSVDLSFIDYQGSTRQLAEYRGRPVVVSVMATWAGPALIEVERIRTLQENSNSAFEYLILVVDEDRRMAAIFAEKFGITQAVGRVPSSQELVDDEGPFGPITMVPTSILLDQDGRIVVRSDGPWPSGVLEKGIKAISH